MAAEAMTKPTHDGGVQLGYHRGVGCIGRHVGILELVEVCPVISCVIVQLPSVDATVRPAAPRLNYPPRRRFAGRSSSPWQRNVHEIRRPGAAASFFLRFGTSCVCVAWHEPPMTT